MLCDKAWKKLGEVEDEPIDFYHESKELEKIEVVARKNVDGYLECLHVIKRFKEKRNLTGMPPDNRSFFFAASVQLEALMEEQS